MSPFVIVEMHFVQRVLSYSGDRRRDESRGEGKTKQEKEPDLRGGTEAVPQRQ